jgi:opacity protein-like surface antigen
MNCKTISIVLAAAALAVAIAPASAQTQAQPQTKVRRHPQPVAVAYNGERPPLTVNKRSFLDPGPVVPVGTMQNYVTVSTIYNRTPDQVAQRSKYGNETLPWPLEIPGRDSPIFEFETPPVD